MGSEMKIELPTQLIEDTIRAEMIRAIPEDQRNKLIEAVVRQAMTAKKDIYDRTPTYFQEAVNGMIRDLAQEIFREWLNKNREAIAKALHKYMNENRQARLTEFAEKIAQRMNSYRISVNLEIGND